MQVTVRQILLAVESGALDRLLRQGLPPKGAWKLARMLRKIRVEYGDATAAKRKLFTEENSTLDVKSDLRTIKPEFLAEMTPQADALFDQSVEIDVEPVTPEDIAGASITVQDLEQLGPLVAE